MISVEVIFCPLPGQTDCVSLQLDDGATALDALDRSGLLQRHALVIEGLRVGIWSRPLPMSTVLRERDRVEIYRPLKVDPKEARRLRYRREGRAVKATSGNRTT